MATTTSSPSYFLFVHFLIVSLLLLLAKKTNGSDMSIISYDIEKNMNVETVGAIEDLMIEFESWMVKHQKTYSSPVEKAKRFEIFKDNLRYIVTRNTGLYLISYKLGLNVFADLTNAEFQNTYLEGLSTSEPEPEFGIDDRIESEREDLPYAIDWREKGAIGPIRDQGKCKSSWAFSAIASVEAINKIVTGDFIKLSEQELVDCDTSQNQGCNGGHLSSALDFISCTGINSERNYPYTGKEGECDSDKSDVKVATIDTYEFVYPASQEGLMKAVAKQPAVGARIVAGGKDFQFYESGVFNGYCGPLSNHQVNVVGYGYDPSYDLKYLIVRNSWGTSWGEKGYMRLQRDVPSRYGMCEISSGAYFPVKNKPVPSPSPSPSPVPEPPAPHICDDATSCPSNTTCCCTFGRRGICFTYGCCQLESATCCKDHFGCCPKDYPVCDIFGLQCRISKNHPFGVPTTQILARPIQTYGVDDKKDSS